jgi:hypothetical protein
MDTKRIPKQSTTKKNKKTKTNKTTEEEMRDQFYFEDTRNRNQT